MTNTVGDAQIKLGLDASGVVTGIGEAKKSIDSLGPAARKAGDGISDPMDKASAATQRFAREVVKTEIALLSGGKQTAAYKQAIAELNGIGGNALKPYLDSLRATEQAQRAATAATLSGNAALNGMGISAKQTAAALRGVPAQFTDIITSLQGGQAPLTVLLQQGGQLKDMFGGIGNAARALGGYVAGLVNPYTVAAAAIGGIAFAFEKGAQEQREFQKALILTGNAAGVTANLLSQAAANIDAASGATQGKAAEALLTFVNAGVRGRESLERFTASAIEFERAGGGSIEKVAENFAKLGKDPLKASLELNDSMNFLTRSLYEQIKALEDQGRSTEAAKLAQEAYNASLNDRTPQLLQNLGLIERGWKAITDATKGAYDAALSVGRAQTPDERRKDLQFKLSELSGPSPLPNVGGSLDSRKALAKELSKEYEKQLATLDASLKFDQAIADQDKRRAESVSRARADDELRAKYLDNEIAKTKELDRIKNSGLTDKEKANAAAAVNKKYEDKSPSGVADLNRGISAQIEALKQGAAIKAEIARQEADTRSSEFKRGSINVFQFIEQEKQANLESLDARKSILQEELALSKGKKNSQVEQARLAGEIALNEAQAATVIIKAQNDIAEAKYKQAKATEAVYQAQRDEDLAAQTAFMLANASARNAGEKAVRDYSKSIQESIDFTKFELGLMGQSDQARAVAIEQYKIQIDLKKQLEAINTNTGFDSADRAAQTAAATAAAATASAAASSKAFLDEWKKTTDTISSSLTDALLRGFESGKGFGDNLKATFKNLSKTLILKPIIEMPVKQAAAALAPLQQKFTEFIATQILGQQQLTASAVTGSQTIVAAKQIEGQAAATAGIANQAGGDPYTAFFRIAAMTALMAALGYAVKGSKGGGVPTSNQGTGTVFGDATAKSASIDNSIKILETSRLGLKYSEQMARSLKNIEAAFAGVTNLVLRNGQIGKLEGSIATGYGDTSFSKFLGSFRDVLGPIGKLFGSLATKLFGTKTTIQGSGIFGGPQSFGDIQELGFQGNYYADVQKKRRFLGITTSTSNSTILNPLDEELSRQFTQIFTDMGDSVLSASKVFGLRTESINAALESYIVDIGKIDLKGLNGEQIQEKLAAVFGAEFDKLAQFVIPGLEAIQQVGEGYGETLVRAATQLESVNQAFRLLGGSLTLAEEKIGLAGVSMTLLGQDINIAFDRLKTADLGAREGRPGIAQAITADAVVQQFGGLEEFNSATQAFYEAFYSPLERTRAGFGLLGDALDGIGLELPTSAAAWRDLTTSLDVTTEAGREAFEALITLGPAFAELQNQLLDSAGISGGAIADVLRDGMLGRITQEDIGSKLSGIIIDGIYNSLANGFAEQISSTFTSQIIAPMLQSVATGGVLSASISQASIDAVVATATNAANQLTAILGDAGFQSASAGVQSAINGISAQLPGLNASSNAAKEAARAWSSVGDSITQEIKRIRGVLAGNGADGESFALSQFATLTAQARAGDIEAAKQIVSASQAYLGLVNQNAGSLLELRRAQGYVIGSLEQTQQTLGLAPTSGTASPIAYQGPLQGNSAPVSFESILTELRGLREEVAQLKAPILQTEANTKAASSALEDAGSGKKPFYTEAV